MRLHQRMALCGFDRRSGHKRCAAATLSGHKCTPTDSGTARVQVVDEKMLVFINDLLSSGEIPDLFPPEDKDEIINAMRSETKANGLIDTNDNCWATFINKVKANLHMVFTASPVGDNFRIRSQRFLATINSTVIDWFQPWPETSLLSVAERFLKDVDLGNDTVRDSRSPARCASHPTLCATCAPVSVDALVHVYCLLMHGPVPRHACAAPRGGEHC